MKTKIQIKHIYSSSILFEFEKEDNTIRDTVEKAVKQNVNLSEANLRGVNLYGADLSGANLRDVCLNGADLRWANLCGANLINADLRRACLNEANLSGASLREANLSGANLQYTDLREANLCGANLIIADLRRACLNEANLQYTDLREANLSGAKNIPFIPLNCPSEGSFIGWKKVAKKLVKLEIPEDAKRSSATSMKCRCSKAKVLSITNLDGNNSIDEIWNKAQEHQVLYKVGEMVYPDSFDEDRWNECSHGIHFFINKQDAINY